MKIFEKYGIPIILVLVLAFFAEFLCQKNLWMLPKEQKGFHPIPLDEMTYEGFDRQGECLEFQDDVGKIRIPMKDRYVGKLHYQFSFAGKLNAHIAVYYYNEYGDNVGNVKEIYDQNNSRLTKSTVNIGKKVDFIEITINREELLEPGIDYIDFTDMELTLFGFSIENSGGIREQRLCFFLVAFGFFALLWLKREYLGHHIERGFLLTALLMGTVMIVLMPTNKVGWDEEVHFRETYLLSEFPGKIHISESLYDQFRAGLHTWPYNQPGSVGEKTELDEYLNQNGNYKDGEIEMKSNWGKLQIHSYFGSAMVMKVARLFGVSFPTLFMLGRLTNLIIYSALMYFAIKFVPIGKVIMTFIGLMPTTLFLACVYSYDATLTGLMYLGLALLLRELSKPKEVLRVKTYLITGAVLFLGCIIKAVYAPMILCAFLLERSKFPNSKQEKWMKLGIVVAFVLLIFSFILPELLSTGGEGDFRGGNTSHTGQLSYILGHPIVYTGILVRSIVQTLPEYFAGSSVFGVMGYLKGSPLSPLIFAMAVVVILTDGPEPEGFRLKGNQKLTVFIMTALSVALIWTAMYMSFTEPGVMGINGVQGRYYIPLLFPVYLLLTTDKVENKINRVYYHFGLLSMIGLILTVTIYHSIVLSFCV